MNWNDETCAYLVYMHDLFGKNWTKIIQDFNDYFNESLKNKDLLKNKFAEIAKAKKLDHYRKMTFDEFDSKTKHNVRTN